MRVFLFHKNGFVRFGAFTEEEVAELKRFGWRIEYTEILNDIPAIRRKKQAPKYITVEVGVNRHGMPIYEKKLANRVST